MTSDEFHDLCRKASKLAVAEKDRIGRMRLTQARGDESTIREPEMLQAFCRTLDSIEPRATYGIEVPTDGRFRFVRTTGDRRVKARHDLVVFNGTNSDVLIELKREQPAGKAADYPAISKDLRKLLVEEARGKAMFHICHASDTGTLPSVIKKYEAAMTFAKASVEVEELKINDTDWFAVMILVLYDRNRDGQPVLHHYIAQSITALLEKSPVFDLTQFNSEIIQRAS